MINIDLSQLHEVINERYYPLLFDTHKFIVLKGSAGSGKSHFAAQKALTRIIEEQDMRVLVVRKVGATNRNSTFLLFKDMIREWGLEDLAKVNKTDMTIEFPDFNSSIIFIGVDDPEKIKSIAGIKHIFIEEATELSRDDVTQLALRLRGKGRHYLQIMMCFNPVSESHWIKKEFFDIDLEDVLTMSTTYKDNKYLDDEYIKTLEGIVKNNPNYYRIYVLGEWGQETEGNEMYFNFKEDMAGEYDYDKYAPLHLSFDFNVVPYLTLLIYQIHGNEVYQIDEICAKHPDNTLEGVCKLFRDRYTYHTGGLFIYGDPSGLRRDVREHGNYFSVIHKALARYKPRLRVINKPSSVASRVQWINEIIGGHAELGFKIDKKCRETINDLLFLKQAQDGTKLKKKEKDEITGERVETRGHCTDALEYLFVQAFFSNWIRYNAQGNQLKLYSKKARVNERVY